ncbi:MAG TPA: ATP-dependent protease ATPase subunit HslU [Armatimonadetes bacterium]|nr:ATP-dependent protease ATPase subunit HslU [Armatimonadota bacterium]
MKQRDLTPREIVAELDKYIIGQDEAKRAVAIALRNRYRRRQLPPELQEEVIPKNILMIGSTGIGKTEIARRLAKLANAPFVKVEATKFTEVGYVGRDVDSMVRDLMDVAIRMVEEEKFAEVREEALRRAVERIVDALEPSTKRRRRRHISHLPPQMRQVMEGIASQLGLEEVEIVEEENAPLEEPDRPPRESLMRRREETRRRVMSGELDGKLVEIEVEESQAPVFNIWSGMGEEIISMQDALGGFFPPRRRKRKVPVAEAKEILAHEEAQKLVDRDTLVREAIDRVENDGIIFIDELDKVAGRESGPGPDVSREGVQRDILPVVEGCTVMTKYGPVNTSHILFIAAGAFHVTKPSDLIPELQGRFPIRVELQSLTKEDLKQILVEPRNSLIRQYTALLETEGVKVEFTPEAIDEIAEIACQVNEQMEDIGARRLQTVMEKLLDELSFAAPDIGETKVTITREYVRQRLADIVKDEDLSRYIL